MPYATSNVYDTMFGGKVMRGGAMSSLSAFIRMFSEKKDFLVKVFATMIVQLGITYYIMMNYPHDTSSQTSNKSSNTDVMTRRIEGSARPWLLFFAALAIIFAMAIVPMPIYAKISLFTLFSGVMGVLMSYSMQYIDPAIVQTAVAGTASIFVALFLFGAIMLSTGIVLGNTTGLLLLGALLLLIVARIVSLFMGDYTDNVRTLSVVTLMLFSLYVVYDTNRMLQKDYFGDFVTGALEYYLDILNIFMSMVRYQQH